MEVPTYRTAKNEFITLDGICFAYRKLGPNHGVPLFFNMHFRGTMDYWDPALVDPIAAKRPVLLMDNAGVGRTTGKMPDSFKEWAAYAIKVVKTLGYSQIDVFGFSMGGYIAQLMALEAPFLVRRLIIAGSAPSQGPGVKTGDVRYIQNLVSATTEADLKAAFLHSFFSWSEKKQAKGEQWWKRITAQNDRESFVAGDDVDVQVAAILRWEGLGHREEGSYDRLHEIEIPVLVAAGNHDFLVPTESSILLWSRLVNADAHLHIYPDSGHGFLFEYHDHFSKLVNMFLDEDDD